MANSHQGQLLRWTIVGLFAAYTLISCAKGNEAEVPDESLTATITPAFFYSPGYIFNLNYGPNVSYDYIVETNYPGHTIKMSMIDCEIESDKNGNCYYDKLRVYDGTNDSATLLEEFCCPDATYKPVWLTTGPYAYLSFTSDPDNEFKGFKIEFVSDGITTTTTTTSTTTTTTTTTTTPSSTVQATGNNANPASNNGSNDSNAELGVIVGVTIGGLFLIVLIVLIIVCLLMKSKRPRSVSSDHMTKRVLWSQNRAVVTQVMPLDDDKEALPPRTVVQTNIFDMMLPANGGKANQLPPISPPLSSTLFPPMK